MARVVVLGAGIAGHTAALHRNPTSPRRDLRVTRRVGRAH